MEFGETLKTIRLNRNISQDALADGIMSRSSIAKIENSNQQPSFANALLLIHRLGISVLDFIRLSEGDVNVENIIAQYNNLNNFSTDSRINSLITLAKEVYSVSNDTISKNIYLSSQIMNRHNTLSLEELTQLAKPIWSEVENIGHWSRLDLRFINDTIFLVDEPHARQLMLKSINIIDSDYPELITLKCSLLINYSEIALKQSELIFAKRYYKIAEVTCQNAQLYDMYLYCQYKSAQLNNNQKVMDDCINVLSRIGANELIEILNN